VVYTLHIDGLLRTEPISSTLFLKFKHEGDNTPYQYRSKSRFWTLLDTTPCSVNSRRTSSVWPTSTACGDLGAIPSRQARTTIRNEFAKNTIPPLGGRALSWSSQPKTFLQSRRRLELLREGCQSRREKSRRKSPQGLVQQRGGAFLPSRRRTL